MRTCLVIMSRVTNIVQELSNDIGCGSAIKHFVEICNLNPMLKELEKGVCAYNLAHYICYIFADPVNTASCSNNPGVVSIIYAPAIVNKRCIEHSVNDANVSDSRTV